MLSFYYHQNISKQINDIPRYVDDMQACTFVHSAHPLNFYILPHNLNQNKKFFSVIQCNVNLLLIFALWSYR